MKINHREKMVIQMQPKFVQSVIGKFGVSKAAPSPALNNMMGIDDLLLCWKTKKHLCPLNSQLMYGAMCTYPEIRPAVIHLPTKYNRANTLDMSKDM